jgi:hypothetical protein
VCDLFSTGRRGSGLFEEIAGDVPDMPGARADWCRLLNGRKSSHSQTGKLFCVCQSVRDWIVLCTFLVSATHSVFVSGDCTPFLK